MRTVQHISLKLSHLPLALLLSLWIMLAFCLLLLCYLDMHGLFQICSKFDSGVSSEFGPRPSVQRTETMKACPPQH